MTETRLIEDLRLVPLPPWWQHPGVLAALVLALLALGAAGIWAFRRLRARVPAPVPVPAGPPPHGEYLARLEALRARRAGLSAYQLAIEVSEILRGFLEAAHHLRIRYQTTREFLETAAVHPGLPARSRDSLAGFLRLCDAVKFARRTASDPELDGLLDTAGRVIREDAEAVAATPGGLR